MRNKYLSCLLIVAMLLPLSAFAQKLVPVADGWANNSVNVTVFRKNSVVTSGDTQFTAFYDPDGFMTLAKRKLGTSDWEIHRTQYKGNVKDAHNIISLIVDGDGYLHVSWDHHGHPLRYARSLQPMSLQLGEKEPMTGQNETNVTYPEFYKMPGGNLIFIYRDGGSGRGNLVMNRYDVKEKRWQQLHHNLIDGELKRNAYWQAYVDKKGNIHVSWVWRETPDVATNHDMCYARSSDGGKTWENSKGEKYDLPVTAATAQYVCTIPQNSELINQTSMTADDQGNPYIATYWREQDSDVPQYRVIYNDGEKWKSINLDFRKTPFSLKGGGTKRIPISRPQLIAKKKGENIKLGMIFRDEERGEKVSIATCENVKKNDWTIKDLTSFPVGSWEPSFDTELWRNKGLLHIFVQQVQQVDGEGQADVTPQPVQILEVNKF